MQTIKAALFNTSEDGNAAVGIYGLPSIGKTRLACELVTDADINRKFQYKAFLAVSRGTSAKPPTDAELLVELEGQLCGTYRPDHTSSETAEVVRSRLQRKLANRRCFVVLDDVPQHLNASQAQDTLGQLLLNMGPGSKTVITARDRGLFDTFNNRASHATDRHCTYIHPVAAEFLDPDSSKELLCYASFSQIQMPDALQSPELHDAMQEVLRQVMHALLLQCLIAPTCKCWYHVTIFECIHKGPLLGEC